MDPTNLSKAQTFCINEATKIVIIYKAKQLMLAYFKRVMSYLKNFDNSEEFAIVGLILYSCKNHFPRKKDY